MSVVLFERGWRLFVGRIVMFILLALYSTAQRKRCRSDPFAKTFFPFEAGYPNAASWGLHEVFWNIILLVVGSYGIGEAMIDFDSSLFTESKHDLEAQSAEEISIFVAALGRRAEDARCSEEKRFDFVCFAEPRHVMGHVADELDESILMLGDGWNRCVHRDGGDERCLG